MYEVIGSLIPLGLAVSLSPFPIIATILMLLSDRAKSNGVAFLLGWILAVTVVTAVVTLLAKAIELSDPESSRPIAGVLRILLGVVMLGLAWRKWRTRPAVGEIPAAPEWMSSIASAAPSRSFVTGLALAGANPKNLIITAGAAVAIGTGGLSTGEIIWAIITFVLIASVSIIVPVLAFAFAAHRLDAPLRAIETWLLENNWILMGVLLLIVGFVLIGNGIDSF